MVLREPTRLISPARTTASLKSGAHRSGSYLFKGKSPSLIGREQQDTWNRINWDYGHVIKTRIDEKRRLVHFLVPINGSTTCNARLTTSQRWALGMDNGGIAGAWWEVFVSDAIVIPMWPGLPG
jgi:hypothetical protein